MAKKKKTSKFKGKVTADITKQKNQASTYGYLNLPKGVNIFKEEPGRTKLDILPYKVSDENHPDRDEKNGIAVPGELWYKRPFKVHRNIGVNNEMLICLTSIGKPCPICKYRAERVKAGADKEETNALKASHRNLYAVVPIGHKKLEEKPHIWDISQFLFQETLNEEIGENEDYETFPDPEEGWTLKIRFTENQIGTNKFSETSRIDFLEREEGYDEKTLKQVPDLDELLNIPSTEEMEKKFFELEEDEADEADEVEDADSEEEEEEESPKPRKKKSVTKKKKEPEPEEEDDDENEEEEEDENEDKAEEQDDDEEAEEEKPKKKKKKSTTKKQDECPHGYEFGKDVDEYDECEDCDKLDDCEEVYEQNQA